MATKRKPLSKKLRFEVFKRDAFTCQYCGATAPDVLLEADHISPVSKGGGDDLLNLITACQDCNRGKGARELSDDSAVKKQRDQLDELSERREQLELMISWRDGLQEIEADKQSIIADAILEHIPGFSLNDTGMKSIRKWLRKFSPEEILDAIEISADTHLEEDEDGITVESVEVFIKKVPGTAAFQREPQEMQEVRYIRGILRNRLSYCNQSLALSLMKEALEVGWTTGDLKEIALTSRNWTIWREVIEGMIEANV